MPSNRMGDCILQSLENPMLNGILLGLEIVDGNLVYKKSLFPCCEGRSHYFNEKGNYRVQCLLKERFTRTRRLLEQFYVAWPKVYSDEPWYLSREEDSGVLRDIASCLKGQSSQGMPLKGSSGSPGKIWAMAVACCWRFDIHVHVVNIRKISYDSLLPSFEVMNSGRPIILFVEQVDKLWDYNCANKFEELVGFAWRSNLWLVVEFSGGQMVNEVSTDSVSSQFKRMIRNQKDKSPYSWLSRETVSRLKTLFSVPRESIPGILPQL